MKAAAAAGVASPVFGAQDPAKLPGPKPIEDVQLGSSLPTKRVARNATGPNWYLVDAAPLPKDREGIYVLNFAFKPMRMIELEVPGKGRRRIHYLYYRIVNRTGKPVRFVPQFTLVTDAGHRHEDVVIPQAVKLIQAKEAPEIPLLGATTSTGTLAPSTSETVDEAVFAVAVWDTVDFGADRFQIYVRGLSDGYQVVKDPEGKEITRYKALRIDFLRHGDEVNPSGREITLSDPPFEWVYYP
jgi:hypothetical protein